MAAAFPYELCVEGQWDPKTAKIRNKLTIYFQSRKSDGGDCEVESDESDGRRATVRFREEEVRQRVLHKTTHELKIGQETVKMSVRLPASEASNPDESRCLVSKLSSEPTLHSVDLNKRKKEPCSVQHHSALDLKKPRLLDDLKSEKQDEPSEEEEDMTCKQAVIENIQCLNEEMLSMLVENVLKGSSTESKDFSLEVIPESNCAVVTFSSMNDLKYFIMSGSCNAIIKKKQITVRILEMTSKVKAEGLPPNTISEILVLYFERFGEVEEDVVMLEKEQSAIITFKDPKVVYTTINQQHQLKKQIFRVLPYYETLQTALYGKNRPSLTLPEEFNVNIDLTIWHHLDKSKKSQDVITQAMFSSFCKLNFRSAAVTISPLPSLLQQAEQTRKLIQTWRENTSNAFSLSLSNFKSLELHIPNDAWNEIESEIYKTIAPVPVTLVQKELQGTIAVVGLKEDVTSIENDLRKRVETITQRIQREKFSVTEEIDMFPSIHKLILDNDVKQKFSNKFPELEIKYNAYNHKLTLYGLRNEVLETKNKILEEFVSLIRKPVDLHQSVLDFLHNKDLEEMNTALFEINRLNVALEIRDERAELIGRTQTDLKDGEKQLETELGYLSFVVEDDSILRRPDWQDLVSNIKNTEARVMIQAVANQVLISGFVPFIQDVENQLRDFVHKNSPTEKILKAHKTVITFIRDHQTQDLLNDVKGKVNVQFKDENIVISGPRFQVSPYVPRFEKLLKSTHHCMMKIDKPGAKKFFKEKEYMCVPLVKTKTGCLLELIEEGGHHSPVKSAVKPVYQFITPDGLEITINKADMCTFQVDAVVSATNTALNLDGGLSKALSNADASLQDSCNQYVKKKNLTVGDAVVLDAGGTLRCKHIILALAPQYTPAKHQEAVSLLRKTVRKSLNRADEENCQSVAIPAIGAGGYQFPPDLCADTLLKSIKEFCDIVGGDRVLKTIYLVDNNDAIVQAFEAAAKKIYGVSAVGLGATGGSSSSQQQSQSPSSLPQSQDFSTAPPQGPSQSVQTKEGLTITLIKTNIENTTMDVVVNTLSSDLNLGVGAVSNALLQAAGPQLQDMVNKQATAPANIGAVIVTAGANLKNKLVFHAVAPHWNQGQNNEQKALENIIDECLNQAEQRQQKSIIFSAIGTGNLQFPKPLVIGSMLDAAIKFSSKRGTKNVQEVAFALHPKDAQTIQVFTDEFNKKFMIQSPLSNSPNSTTQQQIPGPFSKVTTKSGVHETIVGGVTLQVLCGDITAEQTDIIVNSTTKEFTLKAGVSKAILDKAGPNVEAECTQLGTQPNKGLVMTQAGNLQCKKIIHVSAQSNAVNILKYVKRALEKCAKEKFTSISFPAIGTGQAGLLPSQVADSMMDAVVEMIQKNPQSSLKLIRFVIFQAPMLSDFHNSMQNREYTIIQQKETIYSKIKTYVSTVKSFFTGSWEKEIKQSGGQDIVIEGIKADPACFSICGPTQAAVDKTKDFLEKMISDEQAFQKISDTAILSISEKDQQRIREMQNTLGVYIRLEYKAQKDSSSSLGEVTLTVEGLTRDVLIAYQEIQDMLKRAKDEEILNKDIEHVSELVEWQYEQAGQYNSFDQRTNFELEKALDRGDIDVKISFQGQDYQIKLPEGPAVCTIGGIQINIRRIDRLKATESIPQHWGAMKSDQLYAVLALKAGDTEYNDVLGRFQATCPKHKVLKIERIQNPGMWRNYQNNKSVMEQKNGHQNNEKMLFHGTAEQTINHINLRGFNRSYAGKNAAAYGNGTYFALNANYSASNTYSVPNAQGQKHMYLCRVITGDYTKGTAGMIVPPAKNNTSTDLYDTVVDNPAAPTIFVVFRDDHAYPEYLITFT